jgi:Flp pilus assembly protein CpaB
LNKLRTIIIVLIILVIVAGAGLVFLQFWDPPAPSAEVEKDLPHDVLQK